MGSKNFFVDATIDGRPGRLTGGPKEEDGGFELKLYMRERGSIELPIRISGWVRPGNEELVLEIKIEGHPRIEIRKER